MQVTYIGSIEYFQRCIPKAKEKGYILIMSLISRDSDAQDLYEKLVQFFSINYTFTILTFEL